MTKKIFLYGSILCALLSCSVYVSAHKFIDPVTPVIVTALPAKTARCQNCSQEALVMIMCDDVVVYCCADHVPQFQNATRIEIIVGE